MSTQVQPTSTPIRSPDSFDNELDGLMQEPEFGDDDDDPFGSTRPGGWGSSENFSSTPGGSRSTGPIRNELALARQLSVQAKLNPYQRSTLESLVKAESPLIRDMYLFVHQCQVENKLDGIVQKEAPYTVSDALKDNIRSVVVAVLLSPKLAAYKGNIPKDAVLSILRHERLHIPSNFDHDSHVSNAVEAAIGEELIQTRSRIKKMTKSSITNKSTIFTLATELVKDTKCTVTVPLCGKLVLLRKVYVKDSGNKFWNKVDEHLEAIQLKANGDQGKINRLFKNLITADQELYGSKPSERMAELEQNAWQQGVDEALAGPQPFDDSNDTGNSVGGLSP